MTSDTPGDCDPDDPGNGNDDSGPVDGGPLRWERDSPDEDWEAEVRAPGVDKYLRLRRDERVKPLVDALTEHGVQQGNPGGTSIAGRPIVPDWWDEVPDPGGCPWCQRPGQPAAVCAECAAGLDAKGSDDLPMLDHWSQLTAGQRRLDLAAHYRTDPWTGHRVDITIEWTDVTADLEVTTARWPYVPFTPAWIYWEQRRRGNAD